MLPWSGDYWLVRVVFQRGLAVIYLLAFLVAARQFRPLVGEDGLLPLARYRERAAFRERPSLLYRFPTDRAVAWIAWGGVALSVVALAGVPSFLPGPASIVASMTLWALLWGLYLSLVNAGQTFYGFGWESMLVETGFLAIFLGAGPYATPVVTVWLLRWLLFRNMFGAGLIKLRGDSCWRDRSCMHHHYQTQPMPNPLSWFAHHLPDRFHRLEVLGNHVVELAVPFLYFAPQPYASIAGAVTIGFQGWLMLTGNFSWLNALTIVLAVSTFSDGVLAVVPGVGVPTPVPAPLPLVAASLAVAAVVLWLSRYPVRNMLSERQRMNTAFDPLKLVNTYGAFGSITRTRYQIVIEGTDAEEPDPDDWEPYEFRGQPVHVDERPPQWAPYHLRLDWQLWFAAMDRSPRRHPWFPVLLERLLEGEPAVLSLVRSAPFNEPRYVRAVRYRYRFTTPEERADSGDWWHRERLGIYARPRGLDGSAPARSPGVAHGRGRTDGATPGE